MNTIGKILVILNLLFALLTGGFLVIDFAARNNWRQEAEHRANVAKVAVANANASQQTAKHSLNELKKVRAELDSFMISSKSRESDKGVKLEDMMKELNEQKELTKKAILNAQKAADEAQRRQEEVKLLADVVRKREQEIATAQAEATKYRNEKLTAESSAQTAILRAQGLLKQVQQLQVELAKAQAGPAATTVALTSPSYVNPPPAYVKGKIDRIDPKERTLVQINIGSDVGVKVNNTLEVYRLRPSPEYLGRLRIVEAHHHMAIGRLIRTGSGTQAPLREGDEVASTIR